MRINCYTISEITVSLTVVHQLQTVHFADTVWWRADECGDDTDTSVLEDIIQDKLAIAHSKSAVGNLETLVRNMTWRIENVLWGKCKAFELNRTLTLLERSLLVCLDKAPGAVHNEDTLPFAVQLSSRMQSMSVKVKQIFVDWKLLHVSFLDNLGDRDCRIWFNGK